MRKVAAPYPLWPGAESILLAITTWVLGQSNWTGAFAYEFCFVLGIAAAFIFTVGTAIRLSSIRQTRPIETEDRVRALVASELSLLVPLSLVLAFSIRIPTCRYDVGFAWFALLPMVSALFGAASGIWANHRDRSMTKTVLWALLPIFLFSLLTIRDLLLDPAVTFLHPAFGYFAGPIYDEWIPIELSTITYRIWTIAFALWMTVPPAGKNVCRRRHLVFGLLLFAFLIFREPIGWFHSYRSVNRALPATIDRKLVRLHYDPRMGPDVQALALALSLEFRALQVVRELELNPDQVQPADVYVYPNGEMKRKLTGARYTAIGNPIQRALHLLDRDPASSTLSHELTHVFAAPYGIPGLGLSLRVGLLEGLATAVERERDDLTVHEWARAMLAMDLLPNIDELFTPSGFWNQATARAYLSAGSFCRWLIDTRSMPRFLKIYRGRSLEEVYGKTSTQLIDEWKNFLRRVPLSDAAMKEAETDLRAQPISERRCPHDVAAALESARNGGGIPCYRDAWNYSGRAPFTQLPLAFAHQRNGNMSEASSLVKNLLERRDTTTSQREWAQVILGKPRPISEIDRLKGEARAFEERGDTNGAIQTYLEMARLAQTNGLLLFSDFQVNRLRAVP